MSDKLQVQESSPFFCHDTPTRQYGSSFEREQALQTRKVHELTLHQDIEQLLLRTLSGAENFLESQAEKTVTRENSIRVSNCACFLREAAAGGGLFCGKVANLGMGRC